MAEENNQPQTEEESNDPSFQLLRSFLKDASLEMPHAPEIFFEQHEEQPAVNFKFDVARKALPAVDTYEVVLRATVTVGFKDKVMFLVECSQCGMFEISNVPAEAMEHVCNVVCPSVLMPYVRANVADLINRTGLPVVHLPEVNFESMFAEKVAQAQQQASDGVAQA